ncbi:MAG: hypothetical protein AAGN82_22755 [Myxococcota bacterium]
MSLGVIVLGLATMLAAEKTGSVPVHFILYIRLLAVAVMGWATATLASLVLLRGRFNVLNEVHVLCLLFGFGIPMLTLGAGSCINRVLGGPAAWQAVEVVGGFRTNDEAYVRLSPPASFDRVIELRVPGDEFASFVRGERAWVYAGEGWLGVPWYGGWVAPDPS